MILSYYDNITSLSMSWLRKYLDNISSLVWPRLSGQSSHCPAPIPRPWWTSAQLHYPEHSLNWNWKILSKRIGKCNAKLGSCQLENERDLAWLQITFNHNYFLECRLSSSGFLFYAGSKKQLSWDVESELWWDLSLVRWWIQVWSAWHPLTR